MQEMISQGGAGATNTYIWGMDLSGTEQGAGGIGGLLARITQSGSQTETVYYCYDHNGNIQKLLNGSGAIAAEYQYDAFGRLKSSSENLLVPNSYRFSTKYYDAESDLNYYGYRFYSPQQGRWLSRDPIWEKGGVNLYSFVYNYPIGFVDTLGESPFDGLSWNWINRPDLESPVPDPTPSPGDFIPPWRQPITPTHPNVYPAIGLSREAYLFKGRKRVSGQGSCCNGTTKIEYAWTVDCSGWGLGGSLGVSSEPTPRSNTDCPPKNYEYGKLFDLTIPLLLPGNPTPINPGFNTEGASLSVGLSLSFMNNCSVTYSKIK